MKSFKVGHFNKIETRGLMALFTRRRDVLDINTDLLRQTEVSNKENREGYLLNERFFQNLTNEPLYKQSIKEILLEIITSSDGALVSTFEKLIMLTKDNWEVSECFLLSFVSEYDNLSKEARNVLCLLLETLLLLGTDEAVSPLSSLLRHKSKTIISWAQSNFKNIIYNTDLRNQIALRQALLGDYKTCKILLKNYNDLIDVLGRDFSFHLLKSEFKNHSYALIHASKPTPKKIIRLLLPQSLEDNLLFLLLNVDAKDSSDYLDWIVESYGHDYDVELLRFIILCFHPSNELIASSKIQRWQILMWLFSTNPSEHLIVHAFLDWFFFDPARDSIMLLEPAALLLANSCISNQFFASRILCTLDKHLKQYCDEFSTFCRRSILIAMQTIIRLKVVSSIEIFRKNLSDSLKLIFDSLFLDEANPKPVTRGD